MLSSYAVTINSQRKRLYDETTSLSSFELDRRRIVSSTAFRRLEYKTQVFVNHEGDHYRTRLTHSLEVAGVARTIARMLGLNEDLAENLALSHDLGHPPFGHAGEDALNQKLKDFRGFNHNDQSLKVVTKLESRFADFPGLNLSWEVLEGIAKHNGPIESHKTPFYTKVFDQIYPLDLNEYSSLEAQISSLSDDIAYITHDLEDGLRANLFALQDLLSLDGIKSNFAKLAKNESANELIRNLTDFMTNDLVATTKFNINENSIETLADVRKLKMPLAMFSKECKEIEYEVRSFLHQHMYKHYIVNRMSSKAKRIVSDLFDIFYHEPEILPENWRIIAQNSNDEDRSHVVADYIAGMTDRFAMKEHKALFDLSNIR